jgi:prepilin-type processing-associated H-X9-DG protein
MARLSGVKISLARNPSIHAFGGESVNYSVNPSYVISAQPGSFPVLLGLRHSGITDAQVRSLRNGGIAAKDIMGNTVGKNNIMFLDGHAGTANSKLLYRDAYDMFYNYDK